MLHPLLCRRLRCVVPLQVLSWEGVGGRVARWLPRHAVVWRGRLYLTREQGDAEALDARWACVGRSHHHFFSTCVNTASATLQV